MLRKSFILLLIFALSGSINQALQAQPREKKHERIEAARVSFLTEKMQLTPEQAQKFWPVYNEFSQKRKELKKKARVFKDEDLDALSDAQLREGIMQMMDFREKEAALEKSYVDKFLAVVSPRQLATMYRSEKEFMRLLLKKLDDRK
ncbi:MAG: hypothetical protein EOP51_21860 [Sphingobacteriales bacterium]|nr:MAG: hypothetical protein EOP51_21860 [Sphingobacteriales bacterium]